MRKTLFVLCCYLVTIHTIWSQVAAVQYANDLIAQRKYASAYGYLEGSDPNNQSPEIVMAKVNLLMNFHIDTDAYEVFFLKDLAPNEEIEDFLSYNESNTTLDRIDFSPDSILNKLTYQYPDDFRLHKALGNFYYEMQLHNQNNGWATSDTTLLKKIEKHYLIAYQNGVSDYWSLFGLGYIYLLENAYDKAIGYLNESLKLNPDYALTYYDLAYAYYQKKEIKKALEMGQYAFDKQEIQGYKAEAARLLGMAYQQLGDKEEGYRQLLVAYELSDKDYLTLISLLDMELKLNKLNIKNRTEEIFLLSPNNPSVYEEIMKIYKTAKRLDDFVIFLEEQKSYYRTDDQVLSNIYLYTAISLYEQEKWVQAKINFEKARGLFGRLYEHEHNVFKVIDSYTDVIEKKKVGNSTG